MNEAITAAIRTLNDAFRARGPAYGDWLVTPGVQGLGWVATAVAMVMRFDAFTYDIDPYHLHDFGSFELAGEKLYWKIDLYDPGLVKIALNGSFC